jgi:parvulin-like peptidyl-prolyl isomerase
VAVVAGNPITLQAYHHWLYVAAKSQAASAPGQPVIVPNDPPKFTHCIAQVKSEIPTLAKTPDATLQKDCKQLFTQLSNEVMDFLIKSYWFQALAAKEGIHVTDAQVMKAFDTLKKQQFPTQAQEKAALAQRGFTVQDLLYTTRINVVEQKLLKKHTPKITQQQVANYYNAHKSQFGTPATRDIRIVLTKTKAQALAAKSALTHHQSWTTVAKKYSTDPTTKNSGGLLVGVRQGQEDQALNNAAFAASLNKLGGPVKGAFGYYIYDVTKITPGTQQSLAQSTAQIKTALGQQQSSSVGTMLEALAKKDWFSKTTCEPLYAMADCNGYHPPAATTSAAPPPSTTAPPTTSTAPTTSTKK